MNIIHLSDIHIRNYYYHDEYREVFQNLKQKAPSDIDQIFVTGDIAHTKTSLSPDYFDLASDFFRTLSDIAPTKVFIGNHDCTLQNKSREDAVSPIIRALDSENLSFFKYSKKIALDDNFNLYHLSIFDEDWDDFDPPEDKVNIATFHGKVAGAETDLGWVMEDGEIDLDEFEKYDYGLLGDIHKPNQAIDNDGRVRYAGSMIQQNHGEKNNKGFLYWQIDSKDSFQCEHIQLSRPNPFVTVELDSDGQLEDKSKLQDNCRLKVQGGEAGYSLTKEKIEEIRDEFDVHTLSYSVSSGLSQVEQDSNFDDISVREKESHKNLIKDYYEDTGLEEKMFDRILEINDEVKMPSSGRGGCSNWELKKFEWGNLFNFGEDNVIDFAKKDGVVGIFGENFSGKSSIIDSLLYAIFNSTSKDLSRIVYAVNEKKDLGKAKLTAQIDGDEYEIQRQTRDIRHYKSNQSTSKSSVSFENKSKDKNLNGDNKVETDNKIESIFGTLEDFRLTSLSAQFGMLDYIERGPTKRKEILSKFLDLEVFGERNKYAKSEQSRLRADLKRLEGDNLDEEIDRLESDISGFEQDLDEIGPELRGKKQEVSSQEDKIEKIEDSIENVPEFDYSLEEIIEVHDATRKNLTRKKHKKIRLKEKIEEVLEDISDRYSSFVELSSDDLLQNINNFLTLKTKQSELIQEIRDKKSDYEKCVQNISDPPCDGVEPENCELVNRSIEKKPKLKEEHIKLCRELESVKEKLSSKKQNADELLSSLRNRINLITELDSLVSRYDEARKEKSEVESKILDLERRFEKFSEMKEEFEQNKEAIQNTQKLIDKKEEIEQSREQNLVKIKEMEDRQRKLNRQLGYAEKRKEKLKQKKQKLKETRFEYEACKKFREAMHSDGIPFEIIKNKLRQINERIAQIVGNKFDFDVFFRHDDGNLNIYISHPEQEPRPIEVGSGSEKTVAAIAIRLALLSITTLPRGDFFILDEPATELDSENMQSFTNMIDLIKQNFDTVILISHLDELKDCADNFIDITHQNGFAKVKEE